MLKSKRAVITGGSEGIGLGIAKIFIANDAKVTIIGRSAEKLKLAKEHLGGENVFTIQADLSSMEETKRVAKEILRYWESVDILVNNAAVVKFKKIEEITDEERKAAMSLNIDSPFVLTQALLPALKKVKGNIINMSSYFADKSLPNRPASIYAMSKGAIDSMTKSLAFELGSSGIRVNAIAPGTTHTPLVENALSAMTEEVRDNFLKSVPTLYPLGRLGEVEDISSLALFLASSQAKWITGAIIHADGGLTTG